MIKEGFRWRQACDDLLNGAAWRLRWRWLWGAMLLTVGVVALSPGDVAPTLSASDKFDHALSFAALSAVGLLALPSERRRAATVGLWMLAYGAFIELAQTQIPGRFGDGADFLADAMGIAVGITITGAAQAWARYRTPA